MRLQTCSSVINFARQLEEESAKFYEDLAQRFTQEQDTFLSFSTENRRNIKQIERAYYGVISDALEGCFAFNIEPEEFTLEYVLNKSADSYYDSLNKAIEIEGRIMSFYTNSAEQSKSLMADVPRAFMLIAKKRGDRCAKLRELLGK